MAKRKSIASKLAWWAAGVTARAAVRGVKAGKIRKSIAKAKVKGIKPVRARSKSK